MGSGPGTLDVVKEQGTGGLRGRYSQLMDAAVVKFDLGADEHLTGFLRIEPELDPGPICRRGDKRRSSGVTTAHSCILSSGASLSSDDV